MPPTITFLTSPDELGMWNKTQQFITALSKKEQILSSKLHNWSTGLSLATNAPDDILYKWAVYCLFFLCQVRGILHLLGFHESSNGASMELEKEEQLILKSLRWKGKGLAKGAQDSSKLQTDSLDGMLF